jgi:hypothetical protein
MASIIPNLAWYTAVSKSKEMLPRCPLASVYRCPRYYQSISLLGEGAGGTSIDPAEDTRLLEHWRGSDLWPVTTEQATSTFGPQGSPDIFSNFCPEVTYERFGTFASQLCAYADEIDRDAAHAALGKAKVPSGDPRWAWASVSPMHYSECPLYSSLAASSATPKPAPRRPIGFTA